jgi:ClpP class serine protease
LQPPSGLTGYSAIGRALDAALGDDAVAGLMLEIDSGGGEAAGALDLARRVRQAAEVKPVWAVIDEAAGSSAYAIASGASHILLPRTATAGSVGAVAVNIGRSGELARRGQRATIIRSVSRKARPSSVEALSDDDMAEIEARIADLHGEFAQLVAEHRGLSLQAVNDLQGAMLLAPDAVARGLADEVLPAHEALPAFREHLQLGRAEPSLPQESRTTSMTTSLTRPAVPRAGGVDVEAIRREMQARFSGIMGLEEAQGPMASLASHLACETSLTVEEAAGVLAIAKSVKPATGGHTDFKQAMDRLKNPMVGPDGGGEEDGTLDALLARARLREGRT